MRSIEDHLVGDVAKSRKKTIQQQKRDARFDEQQENQNPLQAPTQPVSIVN